MRITVVGLGNQGRKRVAAANGHVVATVDPVTPTATHRSLEDVPLDAYDGALVCTPDDAKLPLLEYLISNGKHVLVEKPILARDAQPLLRLEELARKRRVACYTAYNHRFEPGIQKLRALLESRSLGSIYCVRMFYGNGTARDIRSSGWRDAGLGVLSDLGSHLLDLHGFLLGDMPRSLRCWTASRFETRAFDHVAFGSPGPPAAEFVASYVSWKNNFSIDIVGEAGSAHLDGLKKWGPSTLRVRTRVLPSGRPEERTEVFEGPDDTWKVEYEHFLKASRSGETTLAKDRAILQALLDTGNGAGRT